MFDLYFCDERGVATSICEPFPHRAQVLSIADVRKADEIDIGFDGEIEGFDGFVGEVVERRCVAGRGDCLVALDQAAAADRAVDLLRFDSVDTHLYGTLIDQDSGARFDVVVQAGGPDGAPFGSG